jgi:hypothetical protein
LVVSSATGDVDAPDPVVDVASSAPCEQAATRAQVTATAISRRIFDVMALLAAVPNYARSL